MEVYLRNRGTLTDSRLSDSDMKSLYIMDSTTITLFKDILKGAGRNPLQGKKKGGIKAHTIIKASENVPCLIRYSAAVRHDHTFLSEIHTLPKGSIITFDKGYVDYAQYEAFTQGSIWYVTRLKDNAAYEARKEYDLPDDAPSAVLKDEQIVLYYGEKKRMNTTPGVSLPGRSGRVLEKRYSRRRDPLSKFSFHLEQGLLFKTTKK
jgi:hypothetical protein